VVKCSLLGLSFITTDTSKALQVSLEVISSVVDAIPVWFNYSNEHRNNCLSKLSRDVLCSSAVQLESVTSNRTKSVLVETILCDFAAETNRLVLLPLPCITCLSQHFEIQYGSAVAAALHTSPMGLNPSSNCNNINVLSEDYLPFFPWTSTERSILVQRLLKVPTIEVTRVCLYYSTPLPGNKTARCALITDLCVRRIVHLTRLDDLSLLSEYLSTFPNEGSVPTDLPQSRPLIIAKVVEHEYGSPIYNSLRYLPNLEKAKKAKDTRWQAVRIRILPGNISLFHS
jgi:hypothetical protein